MFPGDYLPTTYCEDRDEAKRLAQLQQQALMKQAQQVATMQNVHSPSPQKMNRPAPVSTNPGLLGTLVQGFMPGFKSATSSPANSAAPTPLSTPKLEKSAASLSAEMEKVIAEKKRDADICAMPAWYH